MFEITGGTLIISDSGKNGNIYVSENAPSINTFNIASKKSMAQLTINGGSFYQINGKIIYMNYDKTTDKATPYAIINNGYFLAYGDGIDIQNGRLLLYDGDFNLTNIYVSARSTNDCSSLIKACDISNSGKIYSNSGVLWLLLNSGKSKVQIDGGEIQSVGVSASEITGKHIKVISTASDSTIKTAKVLTDEPVVGNYISDAAVPDDYSDFTVTASGWAPNNIRFQSGKAYTVSVTLKANKHFTFGDTTEFYINDNKAYVESIDGDTAKIYYVFTQKGDVDLNRTVNEKDAKLLLKYLNKTAELNKAQIAMAKVTDDDETDILDVIAILDMA